MIFSALVLLFCFTWSIRFKTAAAAGHGSAGTDQNYGTLDQVSRKRHVHFRSFTLCVRITDACLTHCCRLGHLSFLIQVKEKLQQVGLESSNLIIGVDFTKSNEWTGRNFSQFLLLI